MSGFGKPLYINVDYPFTDNPPYVTMRKGLDNSVGSYRRNFTLPEGWENERVLLHFDGIYQQVRHLSPKQYYGLDNGEVFGKFSAVPHGDEVAAKLIEYEDDLTVAPVVQILYMWDNKEQEYVQEEIPARLSVENYVRPNIKKPIFIRGRLTWPGGNK